MDRIVLSRLVEELIVNNRAAPLTFAEKKCFDIKFKEIDVERFRGYQLETLAETLATVLTEDISKARDEDMKLIDVHEMQVREIGNNAESVIVEKKLPLGTTLDSLLSEPRIIQRIFNPQATQRNAYLILDSRYRNRAGGSQQIFTWNISTPTGNYDPLTTAITTIPLRNIIKIKMFPFRFPRADNAVTNAHRLSVELMEFNQQAMVGIGNKRMHFMFNIARTGAADTNASYELNDIGNSMAEFTFHTPIVDINTLSLRFGNPIQNITMDPDILTATLSTSGIQTLLTFSQPHYCVALDEIFILDFTTTDPAADKNIIDQMNRVTGWQINPPPSVLPGASTMLINLNIIGLVGAIVSPTQIYLNAKRIITHLECTYITDDSLTS